ncbi:HD domain-containing protein [Candidatus Saccharibacteria bacterium]|nr:HD domain-containing protein [Candidatus Saccharibacteria bacterium]
MNTAIQNISIPKEITYAQFVHIMEQESALHKRECGNAFLMEEFDPSDYDNLAYRLLEFAENGTVLRSGDHTAGLVISQRTHESDAAHTNLVRQLMNYAMDSYYGWGAPPPHYDRREMDEAAAIHDLPENITGDIPDNRNRDEEEKDRIENSYFETFLHRYNQADRVHCRRVEFLLHEMRAKSSEEGRLLYSADKISAIIERLSANRLGKFPRIHPDSPAIAKYSQTERDFCTKYSDGKLLQSELWTIDYLYGRRQNAHDDTGFFTAALVMTTLLVRSEWYTWREMQYLI